MRNILSIFSKSPLGPLNEMMGEIENLMAMVPELLGAVKAGDAAKTKEISKRIMHLEHEVDILKDEIRAGLPKSLFLAYDRKDFLTSLAELDEIADCVEDLAILFTLRKMSVPEGLDKRLDDVWGKVELTFKECKKTVEGLDELLASGFSGPKANEFLKMIESVSVLEWETDKRVYKASQAFLRLEGKESPIAIMMWMKILDKMGGVADACEGLAKSIRRTLVR